MTTTMPWCGRREWKGGGGNAVYCRRRPKIRRRLLHSSTTSPDMGSPSLVLAPPPLRVAMGVQEAQIQGVDTSSAPPAPSPPPSPLPSSRRWHRAPARHRPRAPPPTGRAPGCLLPRQPRAPAPRLREGRAGLPPPFLLRGVARPSRLLPAWRGRETMQCRWEDPRFGVSGFLGKDAVQFTVPRCSSSRRYIGTASHIASTSVDSLRPTKIIRKCIRTVYSVQSLLFYSVYSAQTVFFTHFSTSW
ncbi:hypothetical protein BS78_03G232100 [Paspalum vaginatum]|nr:hypothetical protein BS78_03G232100 [Paspalum vaginatum]